MKKWTTEEIEHVKSNWQTKTDAEIGTDIGGTKNEVCTLRNKLGLKHLATPKKSDIYHSTHGSYDSMMHRCYYIKNPSYANYGGRGIEVCDRWRGVNGWANFLEDVGEKPATTYTIGRRNNDMDYCPENCEWQTRKKQANTRTNNIVICSWGEWKTVAEWVDDKRSQYSRDQILVRLEHGLMPEDAIGNADMQTPQKHLFIQKPEIDWDAIDWEKLGPKRLAKHPDCKVSWIIIRDRIESGWNRKDAVLTPKAQKKLYVAFGDEKTLLQWSKDGRCVVGENCLYERIKNGIVIEIALTEKRLPSGNLRKKRKSATCPNAGRLITWDGVTQNIIAWSKDLRCKCGADTLAERTLKYGWDFERALTTPPKNMKRKAG